MHRASSLRIFPPGARVLGTVMVKSKASSKWRTGWEVLSRATSDMFVDRFPQWAAAVAFQALLSLFPFLIAGASIAGAFVEPEWAVSEAHRLLADVLPEAAEFVEDTVREAIDMRAGAGALSMVFLLWTGSQVFNSLTVALNVAYDVEERYGFFKLMAIQLLMTVTVGLFFVGAILANLLLDVLWNLLGVAPEERGLLFAVLDTLFPAALLWLAFFLVYRFVPRVRQDWRSAAGGALVATVLFLVARPLFVTYVQEFATYNLIYGSVGIVVLLLLWVWIAALITLFGGELASHIQMRVFDGLGDEEIRRRHERRSPDTPSGESGSNQPGAD